RPVEGGDGAQVVERLRHGDMREGAAVRAAAPAEHGAVIPGEVHGVTGGRAPDGVEALPLRRGVLPAHALRVAQAQLRDQRAGSGVGCAVVWRTDRAAAVGQAEVLRADTERGT